ncbi:hypothetical protein [Bacillus sp. FJAT-44742]|uniref:hypothetical protein n=1 Tax=Bacillus sp. FJAT-44742 TaxID=2014005 RepID=UPI0018E269A1|nr:hypothetical protein [Bacillus sp. FJAT-44742]
MAKKTVEVFTSDCFICEATVNHVKNLAQFSTESEVVVYNLNKRGEANKGEDKAKKYGVQSVQPLQLMES